MARFQEAYKLTLHSEGGYANSPADHGGETFAGIARKFWPNWNGWAYIDAYKIKHSGTVGINSLLQDVNMQSAIADFYKNNFWDVNKLDLVKDQQLANNVYDFGVNSGVTHAAQALQMVVGTTPDGIIGQQTITAVNSANAKTVYDLYNVARTVFYHKLAANPGQLQFLKSWMSRIKPYQA